MFVTTQPKNTTGGAPLAVQPAVTLYGIEGTPCYGDNSTIVFASLQQNPAVFATLRMENGSLPTSQSEITSGTEPRATTLNGTCTFEGLYINENATDYTLLFVATEHGLFAESKPFSVTVGVPHYMKLHRDHTSGVLWAHMATGTRGGKFTVSGTGGLPINPPPRLSLVDKGGNVVIDPQYSRGVSASVSLTRWPTAQKYLNYSDTVWTFSVNSAKITEATNVAVTQGSVNGLLYTELENSWQATISSAGITQAAGVTVDQGGSSGTLVTALENTWTIALSSSVAIVETQNVVVTQLAPTADWTIGINAATITELQDSAVTQGLVWTLNTNQKKVTEALGATVTQPNAYKIWTITINGQGITESQGMNVVQSSSAGTSTVALEDYWTLTIAATTISELQGVAVTQGTATGTLRTALTGAGMTTVVITSSPASTPTETTCLEQALIAYGSQTTATTSTLTAGSFSHIPTGCSVKDTDDLGAYFNRQAGVASAAGYTIVPATGMSIFKSNIDLVIGSSSPILSGDVTNSAHSGATTSILVKTAPTVTFDTSANLILNGGTTIVLAEDVTGAAITTTVVDSTGTLSNSAALENIWTLNLNSIKLTEAQDSVVAQGGAAGTLKTGLVSTWTYDVDHVPVTETANVVINQGFVWSMTINNANLNELKGANVTQGSNAMGTLRTTLQNRWVFGIASQSISELGGATVTQGSSSGLLVVVHENVWTMKTNPVVVGETLGIKVTQGYQWDITLNPSIVVENAGVTVTQRRVGGRVGVNYGGLQSGTLRVSCNGPTTTIVILVEPGTVFDTSANLIVGTTVINARDVIGAVASWDATGTLKTALRTPSSVATSDVVPVTTSMFEITGEAGAVFVSTESLVIGSTILAASDITNANNWALENVWTLSLQNVAIKEIAGVAVTQGSSTGQLKVAMTNSANPSVVITAASGVTFDSVTTLVIGTTSVTGGNIVSSVNTGATTLVTVDAASGVIFSASTDLVIGSTSTTVVHANINSAATSTSTTSVHIDAAAGVTFDTANNLVIGSTTVLADDVTNAVSSWVESGTLATSLQNIWTIGVHNAPVTESQSVAITQGTSQGTLVTSLENIWNMTIASASITESQGVVVNQGKKWAISTNSAGIGENANVAVTQANGYKTWTMTINTASITESQGAAVTQGSATGTLKILLNGATTSVVITSSLTTTYDASTNLVVGSTTVLADDVTNAAVVITPDAVGTLHAALQNVWTANMSPNQIVNENIGATVTQGLKWTVAIQSQGITKAQGVPVTQGFSSGTLATTLVNVWTMTINAASITESQGAVVSQGSTFSGILQTALNGDTTSVVISTQSHIPFDPTANLVIGSTTVAAADVTNAVNTGASTAVVINAEPGVTFNTLTDLVIGGAIGESTVKAADLISATFAWDTVGTLRHTYTGSLSAVEIVTASGVTFGTSSALVIGTTVIVAGAHLSSFVNSGSTSSFVIDTASSVTFDTNTDLVVGATTLPISILTGAVFSWYSTGSLKTSLSGASATDVIITAASGVTFNNANDLVIGSTTVLATNVNQANNEGATTTFVVAAASGVVFNAFTDFTVGSTNIAQSLLMNAVNTGATTSVVVIAASGAVFDTTRALKVGSTMIAPEKLKSSINTGMATTVLLRAASGVVFDTSTDIVIGSATVSAADITSASSIGDTTSITVLANPGSTPFDADTNLIVGSTVVPAVDVISATQSWLATGTLNVELTGASINVVSVTAANGQTFDASNSMVVGTTVVAGANINFATVSQTTTSGTLKYNLNGTYSSIVLTASSGIAFHALTDLMIGSTTLLAANLASASNTGATTLVKITAPSGVTFNMGTDFVIGDTTVSHVEVSAVVNTGATTKVVVTVANGLTMDTSTDLVVGSTTILGSDIISANFYDYDPVLTNNVDGRIGVLSAAEGTSALSAHGFKAGTATFNGLQIDVAGNDYLLEFTVSNLTYAFPDYITQPYKAGYCSQSLILTQAECVINNTWTVAIGYCNIKVESGGTQHHFLYDEFSCSKAGGNWIPPVNGSCSNSLLTELGEGNCTATNTWTPVVDLVVESIFETPIGHHNLTFNVTADIGVGPANKTLVKSFPYGSVLGGEAMYPVVKVWLVDAGLNLISTDSVSRCTASLYITPFHGREQHPGYGVARIGTELLPSLNFSHSFLEDTLFNQGGNQSLTVDFNQGVASFYGLNVSHIGGPYTIMFNATSQINYRTSPNGFDGFVVGYTDPFYVAEGKPRRLEVLRRPFADVAGRTPFQPQPVIALVDAGGNIIRSENTNYVTASLFSTTHSDGASNIELLGTKTIKLKNGIAQFIDLALEDAALEYVIKFTTSATYITPRYAPRDTEPLSVHISVACRYAAVKTLMPSDPQPRDGFGYSVDTESNFDTNGVANGRMLMVSGSPFEDKPVTEIQTVKTKAESTTYVKAVQTITTSVLHIHEIQQIATSVSPGNKIQTTVVQTGDRIDLIPRFKLRWKHNDPLSNFIVYEDPPHYPNTETEEIPWNVLPDALGSIIMRNFKELGVGNVDVTRYEIDQACNCVGAFHWRITFRDIRGPVPLLEAVDSSFSTYAPTGTITTTRIQASPSVGGFFTLSFPNLVHTGHIGTLQEPATTRNIPFNTSAAEMANIITSDLWNFTNVEVSVVGILQVPITYATGATKPSTIDFGRVWTVTFDSVEKYWEVPEMLPSSTGLLGHGAQALVATYVQGAAPVGGHFALGFRGLGNVGAMLRWNATSTEVKLALENLHSIYDVDVIRSEPMGADRSYEWTITFNRVADLKRRRKEIHEQIHLKSPIWSDEQYQDYSWNDWIDTNGNLPPLEVNQSLTFGSNVKVQVGAVYDMTRLDEVDDLDVPTFGPSMRNQILNNVGHSMLSGTYKNFGGATKKSARMGHYGNDAGAAYIFTRNESEHRWSQRIKLQSIDTTATDRFGHSVSASGTAVLIGAPGANDDGLIEQKAFRCVADGGNFRLVFRSKGHGQSVTSKQYTRTTNQGPAPHLEQQPEEGYAEENTPTKAITKALWAGTLTIKELSDELSDAWSVGRVVIRQRSTSPQETGKTVESEFERQMLTDPKDSSLNSIDYKLWTLTINSQGMTEIPGATVRQGTSFGRLYTNLEDVWTLTVKASTNDAYWTSTATVTEAKGVVVTQGDATGILRVGLTGAGTTAVVITSSPASTPTEATCLEQALIFRGSQVTSIINTLTAGSFSHVPSGCSIRAYGQWGAFYNRQTGVSYASGYEVVPATGMSIFKNNIDLVIGTTTILAADVTHSEHTGATTSIVVKTDLNVKFDTLTTVEINGGTSIVLFEDVTAAAVTSEDNLPFLNTRVCQNGNTTNPFVDLVIFFHARTRDDLPSLVAEPSPMHMFPLIVNGTAEHAQVQIMDLVHGTPERLNRGAAHVFRWNRRVSEQLETDSMDSDMWYEEAKLMIPPSMSNTGDQFGYQVELEGGTAIVSAPGDQHRGPDSGAVYVFKRTVPFVDSSESLPAAGEAVGSRRRIAQAIDAPEWAFSQRLTSQDFSCGVNSDELRPIDCSPDVKLHTGRRFGVSLHHFDGTIVVAERPNDSRWGSPRVLVYRRMQESDKYQPSQVIVDPFAPPVGTPLPEAGMSSMFGFSMAIDKDTLAIGAPGRGTPGRKGVVLLYKRTSGLLNFPLVYESRVEAGYGAQEGDGFGSQIVLDICSQAEANPATNDGNDIIVVASHPLGIGLPKFRPRKLIQSITTTSTDNGTLSGYFYVTRGVRRRTTVESERDMTMSSNFDIIPVGADVEVRRQGDAGIRYYAGKVINAPTYEPNPWHDGGASSVVDDTYAVRYVDGHHENGIRRQRMRRPSTFITSDTRTRTEEFAPIHTRRIKHDSSAADFAIILAEDLGMYGAVVERWGPDAHGGHIWVVTHQREYGEKPVPLGARTAKALVSSVSGTVTQAGPEHGRSKGGAVVNVKTLNKPGDMFRRGVSVFFRDRSKFMQDGSDTWIKHGVMRPISEEGRYEARGTDLMGASPVSSMAMSGGVISIGAPNMDSYFSGNNAGGVHVFDLSFFNIAFDYASSPKHYSINEDGGTITIDVRRCSLGTANLCRVATIHNQDAKTLLQYAEYVVGDGEGSRVPSATERHVDLLQHPARDFPDELCPNPNGGCASTATGRADCLYRTRYGKAVDDCLWIPGDSKVYQPSSYDFAATNDYVPDWQTFTMDPNNGTGAVFQYDVVITNDHTLEFPDERLNLRLIVPGIEPVWGGDLWTTLAIKDDGDGGVGLSSYYETLSAHEPEPLGGPTSLTHCVGTSAHIITHAESTAAWTYDCTSRTDRSACQEIPGCSWFEGPTVGALNETNANGPLPSEFANKQNDTSRFNAFGSSVKIDKMLGNIAVVSAPQSDIGQHREAGAVYIYHKRSSNGAWERVKVLVAPDPWFRAGTHFGRSIAISNGTLVVGADHHYANERDINAATRSHRAYVFQLDTVGVQRLGTEWTHVQNLTWPLDHVFADASGTNFGGKNGVAVSGNWIAIAAAGDESVFLFQRCTDGCAPGIVWEARQRLRRPNHNELLINGRDLDAAAEPTIHQRFLAKADYGAAVALWNDTVVVGCPNDEYELTDPNDGPINMEEEIKKLEDKAFRGRGSVYVYLVQPEKALAKSNASWKLQTILHAPDASQRDRFGESVDISWDYLVVGMPSDTMKPRSTWDFETGNLVGWHKTGTAFEHQPTYGDNSNARAVYGQFQSAGTDVHERVEQIVTKAYHDPEIETNIEYHHNDYVNQQAYRGGQGQESRHQLKYWIGTYENRTKTNNNTIGTAQGDVPQGTLTSDPFPINGNTITFLIGGGCNKDVVRVELLIDGEQFVFPHLETSYRRDHPDDIRTRRVLMATGECKETMRRVEWDVTQWTGLTAQFRIVDQSSTRWGHINVDAIEFGWNNGNINGAHGGTSGDGNVTCSQGGCDGQMGQGAGAAYLFRRVHNDSKTVDMGNGRSEPELCEQRCNSHGCHLVNVDGQFADQLSSPFYTGDQHTHRWGRDINRWNCKWNLATKMLASDRRPGDNFGTDVSINGYTGIVAVGAPHSRTVDYLNRNFIELERRGNLSPGSGYGLFKSGAIYLFAMANEKRSSTGILLQGQSWNATETVKLQPPQKMTGDLFGTSVAIDESYHVLSGAPRSPTSFESYTPENGMAFAYDVEFLNLQFKETYINTHESIYYKGDTHYDFSENFVEIDLIRTGELTRPLSVGYATSDITAVGTSSADADLCFSYPSSHRGECGDYVQTNGIATFEAGVSLVHIRVYVMEDFCPEPTEYFRLQLYVPGGDVIMGPEFSVTIEINDDDGVAGLPHWKSPNIQFFSDGTQSDMNCVRRIPERAFYESVQVEKDRVISFLDRPEEKIEFMRMVGSGVASRKYMSMREGYYNDGSPRLTEMYGGYERPTKSN